jgi:hypothetical protein
LPYYFTLELSSREEEEGFFVRSQLIGLDLGIPSELILG